MSLLAKFLAYTIDPEAVAKFQKACGLHIVIEEEPDDLDNSTDGRRLSNEIPRHRQNGHANSEHSNGKASTLNGVCNNLKKNIDSEEMNVQFSKYSETESYLNHRNGLLKSNGPMRKSASSESKNNRVIRSGTVPFRVENSFLYYLFCFGAGLGNATFYIIFYSFSFWNFDSFVTRRICLVWCICMYFGQATKDIVRWPRPKSPPVVRLETRYELEYGMPSTHAIVGCALPFSMLIFTTGRYEYPMVIGLVIALSWCILVCLSRIYLGMHTILDVLVGILFAVVVMTVTIPLVDQMDEFLVRHPLSPCIVLSLPVILTLLYPTLDKWSTARGDTTLILSICAGCFFGSWLNFKQGFMNSEGREPPFPVTVLEWEKITYGTMRLVCGIVLSVTVLMSMKTVTYGALCYLLKMDPKDPTTKQKLIVELPYKFLTYFATALNTVYTTPLLFYAIGIPRLSYYTEI